MTADGTLLIGSDNGLIYAIRSWLPDALDGITGKLAPTSPLVTPSELPHPVSPQHLRRLRRATGLWSMQFRG